MDNEEIKLQLNHITITNLNNILIWTKLLKVSVMTVHWKDKNQAH